MNAKLLALAPHFDTISVHLLRGGWCATANKDRGAGVNIEVKSGYGHDTPEQAVDVLHARVQALMPAGTALIRG